MKISSSSNMLLENNLELKTVRENVKKKKYFEEKVISLFLTYEFYILHTS